MTNPEPTGPERTGPERTGHEPVGPTEPSTARSAVPVVAAIDNDGVGATTAGTVAWLAALVITSLSYKWLHDHGWEWAIGTSALGFVFGLFGVWYTVRRRSAYRAAAALGDPRVAKQN